MDFELPANFRLMRDTVRRLSNDLEQFAESEDERKFPRHRARKCVNLVFRPVDPRNNGGMGLNTLENAAQ